MALITRFYSVLSVVYFCGYSVSAGVIRNGTLYRLDIIHFNDFHARFEETSQTFPVCITNDTSCLGGFARLYQEALTLLQAKPKALLLNAGDVFQGTYWYSLLKWDVTRRFMNLLPIDAHFSQDFLAPPSLLMAAQTAMLQFQDGQEVGRELVGLKSYGYNDENKTIGNHEFDDGVSGLAPYLASLKAPVVVANIDTTGEPALKDLYKPHIVVERGGRKIGIIGLITTATAKSSNPEKVKFLDPLETVKNEAQKLTDEGVDIVVVLSHCGIDLDKEMAKKVGGNIDIIVGGHSHSLLWNGPASEPVSGPYPVIVETESNPEHKVVIVTASAYTKYLGNLTTYFDAEGELRAVEGEPVYLNRSVAEDPTIKSLLQPYMEKLHLITGEVVGQTEADLLDDPCTKEECELGNLVADTFLNITKYHNASNLPHVSLVLRNMIRGSLPKGDITRGGIINVLPFTNKVVTFAVTGGDLLTAFRICVKSLSSDGNRFYGPYLPHVAGMRLTLNTTSGEAQAVSVYEDGQFRALQPDKHYQLTSLKFLLDGGNGFDVFKENGRNPREVGLDSEIFEQYITKNTPIAPHLDNRLAIVH